MLGILWLLAFAALGLALAFSIFPRLGRGTACWLGVSAGMVMAMILPSVWAFPLGFGLPAQLLALGTAGLLALAAAWAGKRRSWPAGREEGAPAALVCLLVIPFALLSAWLQHTHILRLAQDGSLHVGQSTYGDLCLHLGIATGLRGSAYPPQYTLLPGTALGYPFLMDALSASMMLLGTGLRSAMCVPGTLFMALVYWGFVELAWRMTRSRLAAAIAFCLVFLNGGLGFLYTLDFWPAGEGLREAMEGFYRAPANLPDLNLRWSNVICDLMIPQRTLLAGWMMLMPALWLLQRAAARRSAPLFALLGLWAGCMPMVHTHTFLALGLFSAGFMVSALCREAPGRRRALACRFLLYGGIAAALALPQLLTWTFPQTLAGGSLRFHFNWVNNQNGRLRDGYFWFWLKNVGPAYLLLLPAALNAPRRLRPTALGALAIYAVAELVLFQPNDYDNNKLFYVAYIAMTPLVGLFLRQVHRRLAGIRGRSALLALFLAVGAASGTISLARECVSDYQLFSAEDVRAAAFAEASTPANALFLTGTQHNNPISSLAGRRLVCGTSLYLYFHGLDTSAQQEAARQMYETPIDSEDLFAIYGIDYIYISNYELAQYHVDKQALLDSYQTVYESPSICILAVSQRAIDMANGSQPSQN